MSEPVITYTPGGEPIVALDGWRAAYVAYPFSGESRWVLAAREGKGPMRYGPRKGPFLVLQSTRPTEAAILDFLRSCIAGDVDATPVLALPTTS